MQMMEPFGIELNMQNGVFVPVGRVIRRHLSDMQDMYASEDSVRQILDQEGDRLIYEVYAADLPEEEGHVLFCTTVIYPGRIGAEYHMTKGHFHQKRDRAEVYLGLAGDGHLILQADDGVVRSIPMQAGTVAYVPPFWAHRTANTGNVPFIFFAAWPGDAGHDYTTIETRGFGRLMVEQDGHAALIDNPKYQFHK